MNRRRSVRPAVPDDLGGVERAAFAMWDELHAECRGAGWTLLIRVTGFRGSRGVVVELRRGTSVNARALRECAVWRVGDRVFTRLGSPPRECPDADAARSLIREAMASGLVERLHPSEPKAKTVRGPACVHLTSRAGRRKNYLMED